MYIYIHIYIYIYIYIYICDIDRFIRNQVGYFKLALAKQPAKQPAKRVPAKQAAKQSPLTINSAQRAHSRTFGSTKICTAPPSRWHTRGQALFAARACHSTLVHFF